MTDYRLHRARKKHLKYINNMMKYSREIVGEHAQLEAVKRNGYAIQYIHNPSEEIQLEAVKSRGGAIQYIHNPSEAVQREAVKQDGYAIRYIHNPSTKVKIEAVKQNGHSMKYFKQAWMSELVEDTPTPTIFNRLVGLIQR